MGKPKQRFKKGDAVSYKQWLNYACAPSNDSATAKPTGNELVRATSNISVKVSGTILEQFNHRRFRGAE
jgi:hypothetical protein